jgi:hypothetical protein
MLPGPARNSRAVEQGAPKLWERTPAGLPSRRRMLQKKTMVFKVSQGHQKAVLCN